MIHPGCVIKCYCFSVCAIPLVELTHGFVFASFSQGFNLFLQSYFSRVSFVCFYFLLSRLSSAESRYPPVCALHSVPSVLIMSGFLTYSLARLQLNKTVSFLFIHVLHFGSRHWAGSHRLYCCLYRNTLILNKKPHSYTPYSGFVLMGM